MKVIISVGGRFHSFDLARELFRRDALKFIITSYPKFIIKKWGLPGNKIKSVIIKEIFERTYNKLPVKLKNIANPQFFLNELYDKLAMNILEESDIFVGWSSFSLHSLRKAKKMGAKIIIERGSSHILYQNEILKEELEKICLNEKCRILPHPKIIEKELMEYEESDYIAIPSLFCKRTFLEKGVHENKLIHVPYGVDLSQFKQIPKKDKVFRVCFAGALSLRKGVLYLLKAFCDIKLPNSELILIGKASEELRPLLEIYNGKYKYLGHKRQSELFKYYSQSSVFVIMSIEEGLAMVIPQAMACGLPVICTTNTGGEDLVRDGIDGFIIPIRDVEKLKEKLIYLYENPEICRNMGLCAKERAKSMFSWDKYGDNIYRAYLKILKKDDN